MSTVVNHEATSPALKLLQDAGDQVRSLSERTWSGRLITVTFIANVALLVAQQASFRLLAPLIGSSVETWSTIIGVFLLGIALGNRAAGRWSDRVPSGVLISLGVLAGAASVLAMPWLADRLADSPVFAGLPLSTQIVSASLVVCFAPSFALSLVTPPTIRSLVARRRDAGSVSGLVFAAGTLGSLLGNYLTGFVLLPIAGIRTILDLTALCLAASAAASLFEPMQCGSAGALPSRRARGGLTDRASIDGGWHRSAIVTVATCSLVSGALEGAAFRILAPLVGVSMFLSAGVVGAVLAGMSIGNFLGGRLASRSGSFESLRSSLIGCAIATLFVAPLWKVLLSTGVISQAPLLPQIVAWSFLLFFPPALALGLITPQVIRLTMTDPEQAGRVSGRLYAWSTLGCIAGILLSAWLLIERFGAVRTTVLCGAGLVPLIVLVERRIPAMPATSGVVRTSRRMIRGGLLAAAAVLLLVCKSPYDRETRYFSLSVSDDKFGSRAVKLLTLDRLVHSAIDPTDPTFLHYPHEHIQGHFTRAAALTARTAGHQPRVLVIGGGGYSFPRWVESQPDLADVRIDVVEIDPGVTEIAHDLLGLSRSTRIHSIHMDGRQFVKSLPPQSYDLIIQDAVNDFSVPYHLMTRDYNALIRQALRPDAAYLLTVIDSLQSGRFLASAVNTMQSAFPDTRLMAPMETIRITGRSVFIIGGRVPQHDVRSPERIAAVPHWWSARTTAHVFPSPEVRTLIDRHGDASPVLTDDYAPVDTLMAGHFMDMPID